MNVFISKFCNRFNSVDRIPLANVTSSNLGQYNDECTQNKLRERVKNQKQFVLKVIHLKFISLLLSE